MVKLTPKIATSGQIEKFLAAINEHTRHPLYWRTFCYCGMFMGLRMSETIRINLKDIDFTEKTLVMPYKQKNGTEHETLIFTDEMAEKLQAHIRTYRQEIEQSGGWLFFSKKAKGKVTSWGARKQFDRFRKYAGIDEVYNVTPHNHKMHKFSYHSFRHYYLSGAFAKTKDLRSVMILGRHKSIESAMRYQHSNIELKKEIVDGLQGHKQQQYIQQDNSELKLEIQELRADIEQLKDLLIKRIIKERKDYLHGHYLRNREDKLAKTKTKQQERQQAWNNQTNEQQEQNALEFAMATLRE